MSKHDDTRKLLATGLGNESVSPSLQARVEAAIADYRDADHPTETEIANFPNEPVGAGRHPLTNRRFLSKAMAPTGIAAGVVLLVGGIVALTVSTPGTSPAAPNTQEPTTAVSTESEPMTDPEAPAVHSADSYPQTDPVPDDWDDWANPQLEPTVRKWRATLVLEPYTPEQLRALGLDPDNYTEQDLRAAYARSWDADAFAAQHCSPTTSQSDWAHDTAMPLVRTAFSDAELWSTSCKDASDLGTNDDEDRGWRHRAPLTPINDPAFADATPEEVAAAARNAGYPGRYLLIADSETMSEEEPELLAVDLEGEPLLTARIRPDQVWIFDPALFGPTSDGNDEPGLISNVDVEFLPWGEIGDGQPDPEHIAERYPEPPLDADGNWDQHRWITEWCRPETPGPGLPPPPHDGYSTWLVRTDYTDPAAWEQACGTAGDQSGSENEYYLPDLYPVNVTDLDGASASDLVTIAREADYGGLSLVIADSTTMTDPERTLLVVDLHGDTTRTIRVIPTAVREFTRMRTEVSFDELLESVGDDGIYRGYAR